MFHCFINKINDSITNNNLQLTGDPKPIVTWSRENNNLPEGRSRILLDNTLRIEDARPEDQGRYICKGHNEGGNVTVSVRLYVYGKFKTKDHTLNIPDSVGRRSRLIFFVSLLFSYAFIYRSTD